jgi:hypothetical protein
VFDLWGMGDRMNNVRSGLSIIVALYGHVLISSASGRDTYLINVPVAGIYAKPSQAEPYFSQKIYGSSVTIVQNHNDQWVKVSTQDNIQNYCLKKNIIRDTKNWHTKANLHRVKSLMGCVYPRPAVTHKTIIRLPYGALVNVLDATADPHWIKIELINGVVGWMVKGDLEKPLVLSAQEAIERARMFIGIPYIWGGVSTYGFDCSGLVQLIAHQRGYEQMRRNSAWQAQDPNLKKVPLDQIQPGDFIYFGRDGRIIHTAVCSAPGMMIHAYSAQGISQVIETPISFLADIIKEARRLPS